MHTPSISFYRLPFGLRMRVVHNRMLRRMLYRDSGRISFRRYPGEENGGWLVRVLGVSIYTCRD